MNINTNNEFDIFKVGERVFQIGTINCEHSLKSNIINVLDKGFKYIPNYNHNPVHFFKSIISNLEDEMSNLNKQFFIKEEIMRKALVNSKSKENDNVYNISYKDLNMSNEDSLLDDNFTCESLDNFLAFKKKINMKNNLNNIFTSKNCIFFQLELFKELNNLKFKIDSNLTRNELSILKNFIKKKSFKIVELDKNVGSGIISNDFYDKLTMDSLNDENVYEKIYSDPLTESISQINKELELLFKSANISKKLYNSIKINGKLGSFRILPKLHKSVFGCRPIINYKKHFLNDICLLLNFIIRPYVINTESYIKDSQNLIQKTKDISIPKDYVMASADFSSLYSSINHEDCLNNICDFFKDKLESEHINIKGFFVILKLILNYNFFKYKDKYFKQKLGIAMGSLCGPSIANLFVYIYEKKWLFIHRPLVYLRFIDDLFIILRRLSDLESLKTAFGSLSLTFDIGEKVKFLDLEITRNELTSYLDFSLYFKPTNTFSYLHISSNHPLYIFKNLIKCLLIRAKRTCSKFNKFIYFASTISQQLVNRGYDRKLIDKTFFMVSKLDRYKLLEYKVKDSINFNETFILRNNFDNNIVNFKKVAHRAFDTFKKDFPQFSNNKLLIINRMQNNLSSLLVHNFKFPIISKNYYESCEKLNCQTCIYSNKKEKIFLTDNFILPIFSNSSCNSENLIYFIFCSFCNTFYIGQTHNLKQRMYKHIYDIKKFIAYSNNTTSVSTHFNLKHHDYSKHFSFFVYRNKIDNLTLRLNSESFLLNLCKKLDVKLMNEHIPIIT